MIIQVVDVDRVAVVKSKRHTPVFRYPDREVPFKAAAQRMEAKSRQVHVLWRPAAIQNREDVLKLFEVLRSDAPNRPPFV